MYKLNFNCKKKIFSRRDYSEVYSDNQTIKRKKKFSEETDNIADYVKNYSKGRIIQYKKKPNIYPVLFNNYLSQHFLCRNFCTLPDFEEIDSSREIMCGKIKLPRMRSIFKD